MWRTFKPYPYIIVISSSSSGGGGNISYGNLCFSNMGDFYLATKRYILKFCPFLGSGFEHAFLILWKENVALSQKSSSHYVQKKGDPESLTTMILFIKLVHFYEQILKF